MFLPLILSTAWQCKGSRAWERPGGRLAPAQVSSETSGSLSWAQLPCPHPSHSKIPCAWTGLGQAPRSLGWDREFALLCFALFCIAFTCRYLLHLWLSLGQSLAKESILNPVRDKRRVFLIPFNPHPFLSLPYLLSLHRYFLG